MKRILYILLLLSLIANGQDSTFTDCAGSIAPESWLGDGFCDDNMYSWNGYLIDFNCAEFNYDGADCPIPILDTIYGCMNFMALNFVPEATLDDGSCEMPIIGCTDSEAINYNPLAQVDNGGCANVNCDEGEAKMLLEITLDQYPGETGWILTDISTGQPVESVTAGEYSFDQANATIPYQVCVPETGVELILSDTYGDGLGGSQWGGSDGSFTIMGDLEPCGSPDVLWELPDSNFGAVAYSGVIYVEECEIPTVYGCMDPGYMEFNPFAQVDDGSCETEHIVGCLNWNAYNYDSDATLNDIVSVCEYRLVINDSGGDGWGDSHLAVTQGDSIHGIYTLGPGIYEEVKWLYLRTDIPVHIRYFELGPPQVPQEELEFQTMHNSFFLFNDALDLLISGGANPFAFNGAGALQPFEPPFWHIYDAMPYCGDYCIPTIYGCMDEQSLNYDSTANTSDSSCIEVVEGCTSPFAFNYDSLANIDNDSCVPVVVGCMNNQAWNYNPEANTADESCLYFGCTDNLALNYDSTANVNNDNCIYPILGCIDPNAFNFEIDANVDDGSCIPVLIGCMDPTMYNYNEQANTASDNCIPFIFGCTDTTAFNYDPIANTDNGSCIPITPGCTDPNAFNYNANANTEDFSCVDVIYGCTDDTAFNYDPFANTDNGGCIDVLEGCMDPLAHNYNSVYNTDDGSCLYDAGCIGDPGDPYWLNDTCYAWVIMVDPFCCNDEWDDKCQQLYWHCYGDSELDVRDLMRSHNVALYPVPVDSYLNILTKGPVGIKVHDMTGRLVIRIRSNQTHKGVNRLDMSLLKAGVYNFTINYEGRTSTKKVVKK
tara:strand:- start:120 stop:2600 length:2481 start_codon:yes stop_codon:yes gene_type:complete